MFDRQVRDHVLVVVSLIACLTSCGDSALGGSETSVSAFCAYLASSTEDLKSNAESVAGGADGLAVGIRNLSAYTSMLHHLREIAPSPIDVDMSDAVDAWDSQLEDLKELASDPIGALSGVVVTSLLSQHAVASVDSFAMGACNQSVFGTGTAPPRPADSGGISGGTYPDTPAAFSDSEGWNYEYVPVLNGITVSITTSIENSPPGKARLRVAVVPPTGFPGSLRGTDAGRDAPDLVFGDTGLFFTLPASWASFANRDERLFVNLGDGTALGGTPPFEFESSDLPEAEVTAAVEDSASVVPAGLGVEVRYVFNLNPVAGPMANISATNGGAITVYMTEQ